MDIPDDPRDLTPISTPVPHYNDIKRTSSHDQLDKAVATALLAAAVLIVWGLVWGLGWVAG